MKNYIIVLSLVSSSLYCMEDKRGESYDTPSTYASWSRDDEATTTFQAIKRTSPTVGKEVNSINQVLATNSKVWRAILSHNNRVITAPQSVTPAPTVCAVVTPLPGLRRIFHVGISELHYVNKDNNKLTPIANATTYVYSNNAKYGAMGLTAAAVATWYLLRK